MDVAPISWKPEIEIALILGFAHEACRPLLNFYCEATVRLWKKNARSNNGATSIIDHGCDAQGRLSFVGTVAMNGKFQGELFSADTLYLGPAGDIEAEVRVTVGIISGQVKGNIIGAERVELSRTARIFGNIVTPVLVLEEGAVFDGLCKTSRQNGAVSE